MIMKTTTLIVMIALAVAVAKPVSEKASGLIPNDDRLSSEDSEDSPRVTLVPDEHNEVDWALPDDELGDGEAMDGEETVVFRPLFVHRQRQARRKQRRMEQQEPWNAYYRTHYGRHLPRIYY